MANPVNNNGISAKLSVGKVLDLNLQIGGSTKVPDNQSTKIFGNVTENLGKNPNHAPRTQHAEDPHETQQNRANLRNEDHDGDPPALKNNKHDDEGAPPARQNRTNNNRNNPNNQTNNPETVGDLKGKGRNNQVNHGQNGNQHASEQGLENGRGHHKIGNQGQQTQTNQPNNFPGNNRGNHTHTENHTEPHIDNHGDHHTYTPIFTARNTNGQNTAPNLGVNMSVDLNLKAHGNQPNGLIRTIVSQVLRQNDIYLNNNSVNRLINNQTFQNSAHTNNRAQVTVPREINNLVQNIGNRVLSFLDNSPHNSKLIHQISKEISHQLKENIQTAKTAFLKSSDLGATHFKNLNISEKMHVAVELMPRHLPANTLEHIQNYKTNEVLNGLLLARGLVVPGERTADVRNLISFQSTVLPREVSMTTLRDVGQLVKILIADAAFAKTTANLDLAVQKFVRIMIANNELGVLLATINLAAQTQDHGGLISRSLALAQIYELINQLLVAGEKAMKQAMPENAAKNILQKERDDLQTVKISTVDENDELKTQVNKFHNNGAESSLRQFLEFSPAFIYDNSASAFNNPDDARNAQKDFAHLYHNDIEQWLRSGNHRFVKDYDFDKPLGVVVERSSDGVFTANTARFVLVRDASVQGWHFLKSFLVK